MNSMQKYKSKEWYISGVLFLILSPIMLNNKEHVSNINLLILLVGFIFTLLLSLHSKLRFMILFSILFVLSFLTKNGLHILF
jgi:hypothetical protein